MKRYKVNIEHGVFGNNSTPISIEERIMMSKILTRQECLSLDIGTYNKAVELQQKKSKNRNATMHICEYCGRKYSICCICDTAEERWNKILEKVREASELSAFQE